ncbi:ABC transporter substrate-binding protein [Crystallibacter degradans]|uniref:ABC transporter substrate-binding protein n=1 Tax=Crystallibacter degradans TaxID=2726743 RepID=UPI001473979B|nr:ABC transporter substrate-binding protein [Arthrobacter sp. SF27]NMR31182.1 ABC transporter substrate-binding protein [Arthrobacter sp. SF27]
MRAVPERWVAVTAGTLSVLALTACGATSNPLDNGGTSGPENGSLVVGSANFPENETLAEIYAGALNAAGIPATTRLSIGSREVYVRALQDGSIDLVPDYSGNLLRYADSDATAVSAEDVMQALSAELSAGLAVLEPAAAENKNSIVVTQATAEEYGLKSLTDLGKVCDRIALGMPPEAEERPQGLPGLKAAYGCVPQEFVPINDSGGPVTVNALLEDKIQAANVFSTSPLIATHNLITLEDPKDNFAAQQVVPLVREDRVDAEAVEVLNEVSRELTTEDLIELNEEVSGDAKRSARDAAASWLEDNGFTAGGTVSQSQG